jgi:hypothetical protein
MKRILLAGMIAALALGPAMAQETCATKAVDKNGKPLAGAALNSFLKKCKREACEPKALQRTVSCRSVKGSDSSCTLRPPRTVTPT